jgi:hypothetical protein
MKINLVFSNGIELQYFDTDNLILGSALPLYKQGSLVSKLAG